MRKENEAVRARIQYRPPSWLPVGRNGTLHKSMIIKVGPFDVRITQEDGWRKYSLIIDSQEIKSWAANPGVQYCKEALFRAIADKRVTPQRATLLLLSTSIKPAAPALSREDEPVI